MKRLPLRSVIFWGQKTNFGKINRLIYHAAMNSEVINGFSVPFGNDRTFVPFREIGFGVRRAIKTLQENADETSS